MDIKITDIPTKFDSLIYVLALEDGCFYVGKTTLARLHKRIKAHFSGKGSAWTKIHKPIFVQKIISGDGTKEKELTLKGMKYHGVNKVRGASYTQVNLKHNPLFDIEF